MLNHANMAFDYQRPADWAEAGRLLTEPDAVAKMGGCDVLTRFRSGRLNAKLVVGLNRLPGVNELTFSPSGARIGAAVTLSQLARADAFAKGWPVLAQVVSSISSPAIRSSATFVGNVAQGWTVSDLVPLLQVGDAELDIRGPHAPRRLSVVEYAKSRHNKALKPGEAIVAVELKPLDANVRVSYERFSLKQGFDLPLVSVAVATAIVEGVCRDVRIAAVGGMHMPARCAAAELMLERSRIDDKSIDSASQAIASWANPPRDFRASAGYRRYLVTTMLRRALSRLAAG